MSSTDIPSLYEISQLITDHGLEGDEKAALSVTVGMIRGGTIILTGLSSGGKTEMVESSSECFDSGDVFEIPPSTSPTSLFERTGELNSSRVHIHPDLESIPEHLEAMLKRHGDDKPFSHEWTDVSGERSVESREIEPPDTICVCIASNNENLDLNDYPEMRNRAFIISVDGSEEQTNRVNARQAQNEAKKYVNNISPQRAREISRHLKNIPVEQYGRDDSMGEMVNPCAPAINECDPLPTKFTEARRDFPRLLSFMRSIALYNYPDRMSTVDKNGNPMMLVTPADCWLSMKVFGEDMIMSALNLRDEDMDVLEIMREDASVGWTVSEMQTMMREKGHNISDRDVRSSFDAMKTKGYVRKEKNASNVNEFFPSPFASAVDHQASIDWEYVVEQTKSDVRDILTEGDAEEYINRFCEGDGLLATHPFTGETVNILEDNEFEMEVEEAQEDMENTLGNSMYDNDSSNDSPASESEPTTSEGDGLYAFEEESSAEGDATSGTLV